MVNNKGGRPLKFKDAEELQEKIEEYFESCYKKQFNKETDEFEMVNIRPLTITGLAVHLDTTRQLLLSYDEKDEFSYTIKKAKQTIENYAEECLFNNKNTAGVIFNMKNNWAWVDKQEVASENINHNNNINLNLEEIKKEAAAEYEKLFGNKQE